MKKLPIGLSDFKELIEDGYYYVDKSLFIKEILDNGSKSLLLPRPRRFGKTLNLSMLRYFYEKSVEDTSVLFQHLNIWQQGEVYTREQGLRPVIFLTFKDVKCDNWQKCFEHLQFVISEEFSRHRYLLSAPSLLTVDEQNRYQAILSLTASEAMFENSVKQLSAWLHQYHGQKAVILIDEYDTPIQGGYMNGYYEQVIGFMRNMLSGALKDNSHLEKGVLTGILRVAKESIFSGLNNLEVCSLLAPEFSTSFGLLEDEVEALLHEYEIGSDLDLVKQWYNGYMFGDTVIYNPWSILNYVKKWKTGFQPFWVNTSDNDLIRQIISRSGASVKQELETLLLGGRIEKTVDDNVVFREIEHSPETIWSFLLMSGYLKIEGKKLVEGIVYGKLIIPNKEVAYLYRQIILGWFNQSIHNDNYQMMLKSLVTGDLDLFEVIFRDFVMKSFSYFDTAQEQSEKVYHAFVLGLLLGLSDAYEVKSNRESGYGRYDVMLIPKDPTQLGIVIEFKKAGALKKESLEEAAVDALAQIEQMKYTQELADRGITNVIQLGIAFQGKALCMKALV